MHTTLNILKVTDACTGGYGRMISFFGDRKKLGDQLIPLHVVSLVGGFDDAQWALHNSAVIDEEQFKAFYREHLPSVLKLLLQQKIGSGAFRSKEKNPIAEQIKQEALKIQTFEECEAWLKKARAYNFNTSVFSSVLRSRVWAHPATFISFCMDNCTDTFYPSSSMWGKSLYEERKPSDEPAVSLDPVVIPFGRPDANSDTTAQDDEEADEDDYDEEEDDEPPRRGRARPAQRAQVDTNPKTYWFKTSADGRTKGQQAAFLFSKTPFDFIHNMQYKVPRGVKMEKKGDKVEMQVAVSHDEKIYQLLRTMTTKTGDTTDADQE